MPPTCNLNKGVFKVLSMAKFVAMANVMGKRCSYPRKAKEQSIVKLKKLAVIMEVIEASRGVEDVDINTDVKIHKTKRKQKKPIKKHHINASETSLLTQEQNLGFLFGYNKKEVSSDHTFNQEKKRMQEPVLLSNKPVLSHFMELEERTDLLIDSEMPDPLGSENIDNFQWVEIKQEFPDDVEVCKVTLTDLPLKGGDAEQENVPTPPQKLAFPTAKLEGNDVYDRINSGNDSWNQDSSLEDSSPEQNDSENNEKSVLKKIRKNNPQNCDICGKTLSSKGNLRLHKLKKHKEKIQFKCDLCGLKFDYRRKVVQHRNSIHRQEDGRFCCEVCCRRFSDYHSFLLHIKSHFNNCKEDEGSDKVCKECNKTFLNDESLKIHQTLMQRVNEKELREKLKHQEKNFICHTCGKRFAFNCLLRDHMNLHTGTKPYLCQKCGKSFSQKATLKQHAKTHSEIRPFQCPDCPLGFYNKGDLKKHIRKHTGERPYICSVCGERFLRSSHLGVHRRSHTGERPFSCTVCPRAFTKKGDMVRHHRIHTGELPYLCQVCGKAFRQSSQCANHVKSQHPSAPIIVVRKPNLLHQKMTSQSFC